jgi:hypothetical protein
MAIIGRGGQITHRSQILRQELRRMGLGTTGPIIQRTALRSRPRPRMITGGTQAQDAQHTPQWQDTHSALYRADHLVLVLALRESFTRESCSGYANEYKEEHHDSPQRAYLQLKRLDSGLDLDVGEIERLASDDLSRWRLPPGGCGGPGNSQTQGNAYIACLMHELSQPVVVFLFGLR